MKKAIKAKVDSRRLAMEVYIFIQIIQDLMGEFANIESIKARFRYETASAMDLFVKIRKKLKRNIPDDVYIPFENAVCGFVDEREYDIDRLKSGFREQLRGKLRDDQIEYAVYIGMMGGFCDIVRHIKKFLTKKDDMDLADIYRYLKYIDSHIGFQYVNGCDTSPSFEACRDSMLELYQNIGKDVEEWLRR